jgi:hypothetical protein
MTSKRKPQIKGIHLIQTGIAKIVLNYYVLQLGMIKIDFDIALAGRSRFAYIFFF